LPNSFICRTKSISASIANAAKAVSKIIKLK
jgi:hypothetical protein